MPSLKELSIFLYFLTEISGQLVIPTPQTVSRLGSPDLPTPQEFLEKLLNITADELKSVVSNFKFDEVLTEHIQFILYSEDGSVTTFDANSDEYQLENVSDPIKIIIHGWLSTGHADFVKEIAKSYHSIGIKNVYSVNWSTYARKLYLHSAKATKKTGEIVGNFIMNLIKNNTSLLENVHVIGHSLGGHVAGFGGKHIQNVTDGVKIGRITALDLAAPLFEYPLKIPSNSRLTKDDADYVDSIHTDAGFFGFRNPFAVVDFYVNHGGPIQKACTSINIFKAFICSHSISQDYFNRTITSKDYVATSCENTLKAISNKNKCNNNETLIMGEHTEQKANGTFYISIDKKCLPK